MSEPEYEYRVVCKKLPALLFVPEHSTGGGSSARSAWTLARAADILPCGPHKVRRRIKAGPWEDIDDV